MSELKHIGEVTWYNQKLGYGFATCKEIKEQVFIHHTKLEEDTKLDKKDLIEFIPKEVTRDNNEKKIQATHIKKVLNKNQ